MNSEQILQIYNLLYKHKIVLMDTVTFFTNFNSVSGKSWGW